MECIRDKRMEKFRAKLREKRLERDWNNHNRGMTKEGYKIFHEPIVIEEQKSGDALENEVVEFIKKYFKDTDYYLIHDLVIEDKTQLDLLLVTDYGLFIIEVKDWKGEYIVENGVWWKNGEYFRMDGNETPHDQVKRHQNVLKAFLEENGGIDIPIYRFIFINCDNLKCDSRSVFESENDLLNEIENIIENNYRALNPYNKRLIVDKLLK